MTGNNQPAHFPPVGLLPRRAGESKQKTVFFYVDRNKNICELQRKEIHLKNWKTPKSPLSCGFLGYQGGK